MSNQRKTRIEDYLLAVELLCRDTDRATTGKVAAMIGVANGTASSFLRTLAESGLVDLQPYAGSTLTEAGRRRLLVVMRRRQLLELFIVQTLHLSIESASEEAWQLEPAASNHLIDCIDSQLGNPIVASWSPM
ncbi:metal-dependent transcriptional regulator [Novipirellula rosea]|uniref:Transcriptional regulator MntR n=1 Tax=Novipirellula rosea TaxID=1031540 RepID=A0ABP8NRP9_9BACT